MTTNAFWQQGEVQAGRASARPHLAEAPYEQTLLLPPDLVEVRLRLGFIPGDNHMRWQVEAIDPATGELLAMHSKPHHHLSNYEEGLEQAIVRLRLTLSYVLNPDPFP